MVRAKEAMSSLTLHTVRSSSPGLQASSQKSSGTVSQEKASPSLRLTS